jgi:cephalosporin-C deacetylase-like acetyl esterase
MTLDIACHRLILAAAPLPGVTKPKQVDAADASKSVAGIGPGKMALQRRPTECRPEGLAESCKMKSMMIWMVLLLCGATVAKPDTTARNPKGFDYNASMPLDIKVRHTSSRENGVSVVDLNFASPRGGRVPAYLVVPRGKGPFAAIIYGHWTNEQNSPRTSNRSEFLEEAVAMAPAGVVSLLTDAPSARPGFKADPDPFSSQDTGALAQQVVDMRRGVDLLTARSDVDPNRIAYVGHSFDAAVGGVLRGVEPRICALALMAGVFSVRALLMSDEPRMVEFRRTYGEQRVKKYLDEFDRAEPVYYVSRAGKAPVLVQVATRDEFGSEANFRRQADLVAEPRIVKWYDATHALNARARVDRYEWLRPEIGLKQLPVKALEKLPVPK